MNSLYIILAFILGLILGSFLDVIIERSHEGKSWWSGRSKCDKCGKTLSSIELIPIFSFLIQKGKCKSCKVQIPKDTIIVEIISGIILAFVIYRFGLNFGSIWLGILGLLLLGNFISDLKYMELPEIFSLGSIIVALVYKLVIQSQPIFPTLVAGLIGFLFFYIQYFLTKGKGLGAGDLRLGILMGLMLGIKGLIISLFIAYVSGSIISLSLITLKKLSRKSPIPLGVFLIPSLVIVFIFYKELIYLAEDYFGIFSFYGLK